MDDHHSRLARCFSAVFPELSADAIDGARPDTVTGWDSIANVTLLAVVEEEFGVEVPPEDIEDLTSFAALLAYLRSGARATPGRHVA
jgi:acyl carrier protein